MADNEEPTEKNDGIKVISPTSGDKYVVRTPLADGSGYRQGLLSKEEIEARGGVVPPEMLEETRIHRVAVSEGTLAAERERQEIEKEKAAKILSQEQGMSEQAAKETIERFASKPDDPEFAQLRGEQAESLVRATARARAAVMGATMTEPEIAADLARKQSAAAMKELRRTGIEVGRQVGGGEFIPKEDAERINKESPLLYDTLVKYGSKAYQEAAKQAGKWQEEKFQAENIQVGDGKYLPADVVNTIQEQTPELYQVLMSKGIGEYDKAFNASYVKIGDSYIPVSAWNDLPEEVQSVGINTQSLDRMKKAVDDYNAKITVVSEKVDTKPIEDSQQELNNLVDYLDKVASLDFFNEGGNTNERIALENAFRHAGIKMESGSAAAEWRKLSEEDKLKVASAYIAPTAAWFTMGIGGEGGSLQYDLNLVRQKIMDWASKGQEKPTPTLAELDKIASLNYFEQGGSVQDRLELTEAMRRAGFVPSISLYRAMNESDKEKVLAEFTRQPVLSGIIEEKIDKPVAEFMNNLEKGVQNIDLYNPAITNIVKVPAGIGAGAVTAVLGGSEALASAAIKSITDITEGYHKQAAANVFNVPLGLSEWAGVHTPQLILDDPISGVSMAAGALAAPLVFKGIKYAGGTLYKTARELFPSKFEFSNLGLEASVPRTQLRGNVTPYDARDLIGEVEKVWGGKEYVPPVVEGLMKQDPIMAAIYSGMTKATDIVIKDNRGIVQGRVNPSQMAVENVLYNASGNLAPILRDIGKNSYMEVKDSPAWFSPNLSLDVMGWYVAKEAGKPNYKPGGIMVRYMPEDVKAYPPDVFNVSAKQYETARQTLINTKRAATDRVSILNEAIKQEVMRRASLPPNHPEALPPGIYPVFKFHWSREPSGQLRPTYELELISPVGTKFYGLSPKWYSGKVDTGGGAMAKVASLDTYSPIEAINIATGAGIRYGQRIPVIITATESAKIAGKQVPTLAEMYATKFLYKPVVSVKNLFSRGKEVRPRAETGSLVTTPKKWYSRAIKLEPLKEARAEVFAKKTLSELGNYSKLSTWELAKRLGLETDGKYIINTRQPHYHPVYEFSDNWVTDRVGVMIKHPEIRDAYIVFNDTAEPAGIWNMGGGQIDPFGKPRIKGREFGKITLEEAAREQVLSEIGVDLKNVRPAQIHEGKTTEHSTYGTFMFDAEPASLNFKITPGEVREIRMLKSGDTATVTPALFIELQKRGFDVSNLTIADRHLPTAGIKQYSKGSPERMILEKAKIIKDYNKINKTPNDKEIYKAEGETAVEWDIPKGEEEYIVPFKPRPEAIKSFALPVSGEGQLGKFGEERDLTPRLVGIKDEIPLSGLPEKTPELVIGDEVTYPVEYGGEVISTALEGEPSPITAPEELTTVKTIEETPFEPIPEKTVVETIPETIPEIPVEPTPEEPPIETPRPIPIISTPPPPPPEETTIRKLMPSEPSLINKQRKIFRLGGYRKETEREMASLSPVTWNHGKLKIKGELKNQWYVIAPPYNNQSVFRQFEKPRSAIEVDGPGSAYKTIQALGYSPDFMIEIDWGAFDLEVSKPSNRGDKKALRFKRDKGQKTKKSLSVSQIPTLAQARF